MKKPFFRQFASVVESQREPLPQKQQEQTFAHLYQKYQEHRQPSSLAYEERLKIRTQLAILCMSLYEESETLESFEEKIHHYIDEISEKDIRDTESFLTQISRPHEPDLLEAIWATLKNLKISTEIKNIIENDASGMLISGTNAWGPFFAVKGLPIIKQGSTGEKRDASDIDIMITVSDIQALRVVIESLSRFGIISQNELSRLALFEKLHSEKKVDMFSLRSYYQNVEQSMHFLFTETVQSLGDGSGKLRKNGIEYLRDFRPNIPRNINLYGGYPIVNVHDGSEQLFSARIQEVFDENHVIQGYTSETPAGGSNESGTYISLLHFFLQVAPVLLFDKNNILQEASKNLAESLKSKLEPGGIPFIIREDRMMKEIIPAIKNFLLSYE